MPDRLRPEHVQIALLGRNGSFQFGVLLFQQANLLFQHLLKATSYTMGDQLLSIEPKYQYVEYACWRQSLKTTGGLILEQMHGYVVDARLQQAAPLVKIDVIGPEVALVLVALDAGVDQIVEFVAPARSARPIVVESKLAPHSCFGYAAVAAGLSIMFADGLKQRMRHGFGCSTQDQ